VNEPDSENIGLAILQYCIDFNLISIDDDNFRLSIRRCCQGEAVLEIIMHSVTAIPQIVNKNKGSCEKMDVV